MLFFKSMVIVLFSFGCTVFFFCLTYVHEFHFYMSTNFVHEFHFVCLFVGFKKKKKKKYGGNY